jgi:hypothetical protein
VANSKNGGVLALTLMMILVITLLGLSLIQGTGVDASLSARRFETKRNTIYAENALRLKLHELLGPHDLRSEEIPDKFQGLWLDSKELPTVTVDSSGFFLELASSVQENSPRITASYGLELDTTLYAYALSLKSANPMQDAGSSQIQGGFYPEQGANGPYHPIQAQMERVLSAKANAVLTQYSEKMRNSFDNDSANIHEGSAWIHDNNFNGDWSAPGDWLIKGDLKFEGDGVEPIKGPKMICAEGTLTLTGPLRLDDLFLCASGPIVLSNIKGKGLKVFSSHSIVIENESELEADLVSYGDIILRDESQLIRHSIVAISGVSPVEFGTEGRFALEDKATFSGHVLLFGAKSSAFIAPDASLMGTLFTSATLRLQGTIKGYVHAMEMRCEETELNCLGYGAIRSDEYPKSLKLLPALAAPPRSQAAVIQRRLWP